MSVRAARPERSRGRAPSDPAPRDRAPRDRAPVRASAAALTAAVTALALVLLAACSGSAPSAPPSSAPPPAPGSPPPGAGASPPAGGLAFTPCDGGYQCASVPVPVDYEDPAGAAMSVAIVRKPARDPSRRLGVLLVNPGGPGASGIEAVEDGAVPAAVADRFDVVGFDPRGVGRSTGLACPVGPDTPYLGDPDPADPADAAATNDAVDRYVASCDERYPELLAHLGTRDVARDMDRIREILGASQISYLGFSYGTAIGQTYLDMFGSRVRAMVLDGVVDVDKPGLDSAQAESFENALRQFAAACRDDASCPAGPDAIALVDALRGRLATAPLPVPGARSPLTPGLFEIALALPLYSRSTWPRLASALADLEHGDGRAMRDLAETYFQSSDSDTYNAVTCLDSAWPRDDAEVLAASRTAQARAPHFTGNFLVSGLTCAGWPVPQEPLTAPSGFGEPPVLVVGTTGDPATPYANSLALARRLTSAGLVTYRGDGHTAYNKGVGCVDDAVNSYLVDDLPPPRSTIC